jgi:flavin reductase (DIM6/NTAB) family NADH-FMN oxidoreductase RutF
MILTKSTGKTNLSPFSFFQMIGFDPPLFIFGIAGSPTTNPKDSLRNILETSECCVNIISEHIFEAANFTSIDAPYGVSEFDVSGLTPAPSTIVKPPRVAEAIFAVEAKLVETRAYQSKVDPSKTTSTLVVVEGVRFWAREDALSEEQDRLDPNVLRPMSRLGGISYGRLTEMIELPRPQWGELEEEERKRFTSGQN